MQRRVDRVAEERQCPEPAEAAEGHESRPKASRKLLHRPVQLQRLLLDPRPRALASEALIVRRASLRTTADARRIVGQKTAKMTGNRHDIIVVTHTSVTACDGEDHCSRIAGLARSGPRHPTKKQNAKKAAGNRWP